ncbi:hypothetical protein QJS66_09155 [Kocuria rhizophila]|nr:hypothetical protein QJS66_09155 [Kocuria rhizophila]
MVLPVSDSSSKDGPVQLVELLPRGRHGAQPSAPGLRRAYRTAPGGPAASTPRPLSEMMHPERAATPARRSPGSGRWAKSCGPSTRGGTPCRRG